MGKQWTKAQEEAIHTRGQNILVSAAAGAGKTAVLVERLVQLILKEHVGIDQILMVTFTNAAAGEMRSRIYQRLQEVLEHEAMEESIWVKRQLHLVGTASISTIHAFCMEVVREHAFLLDLDPNFRVGDAVEIQLLREEVIQELLEQEYETLYPDFLHLADMFTTPRGDQRLREAIFQVYDFIQNQPDPIGWLQEKIKQLVPEKTQLTPLHPLMKRQYLHMNMIVDGAENDLHQAAQMAELDPILEEKYLPILLREQAMVQTFKELLHDHPEAFYEAYQEITFARLPSASKMADENLKKKVQELRNQAKERLLELEQYAPQKWQQSLHDLQAMEPVAAALQRVVQNFEQRYQATKQERGVVDFNDLEHYALTLLRIAEVAEEYRERFVEIFVDEYQDSNLVQEEILRCIRREQHIFFVGDMKQSIYRFRSADPGLFRFYYDAYRQKQKNVDNLGKVIDMQHNFRSTRNILAAINDLFFHIMKPQVAEIDYDERAKLCYGPNQDEGKPVELLLLETQTTFEEDGFDAGERDEIWEELERMNNVELEASMLAQKIQDMMEETIVENGVERPVRYHDIVILMRSLVTQADTMAQILADQGIPVYTSQGKGYFDVIEVTMFLDLLRFLDNQIQDIPLLGVLRSPIGGFSLEDLVEIRVCFPHMSYQKSLQEYACGQENDLAQRLQNFLEKCHKWQEKSRLLPLSDFIWYLFRETGYYEYVGAMPGGRQRQANLRLLLEKAEVFQNQSLQGLFRFLQYIEKVRQSGGKDDGIAGLLHENDDVVRIMSVHKSKGLEFPIVILAGLDKKINLRDAQERLLLHKELGIGIQYADPQKRVYRNTLPREMIAQTIRMEQLAEEMRVFYVACTRAQQRLIFSARLKNLSQAIKRWSSGNSFYAISQAGTWMDWIGMVFVKHPDSYPLWERIEEEAVFESNFAWSSQWNVQLYDRKQFTLMYQQKIALKRQQKCQFEQQLENFSITSGEIPTQYYQKLTWQYPFQSAMKIPSKITVTQVKQMQNQTFSSGEQEEISLAEPLFITRGHEEAKVSALYRGTLTHQFLRQLDFAQGQTMEDLQRQWQKISQNAFFTEEERNSIRLDAVYRFVHSALGERIRQAKKLYREIPFNYMVEAKEIFPESFALETNETEKIMVQGIIDLYFEEDNEWVLVDYKTDYVGRLEEAKPILRERYALQLHFYRKALEGLTHKKVKMAGLYLLSYGEFLEIDES